MEFPDTVYTSGEMNITDNKNKFGIHNILIFNVYFIQDDTVENTASPPTLSINDSTF